ncbi:MAG: hypothetical protein HY290_05595 [Planctomycetia bacterium]|nr:hypothetical protein [Planctomycetia bacterium]
MAKCRICQLDLSTTDAQGQSRNLLQEGQRFLDSGRKSGDYHDFNCALSAFETARELCSESNQLRERLSETQLAYAEAALGKGDLDLGLGVADDKNPAHGDVILRLRSARNKAHARVRRGVLLRRAVKILCLAGSGFVAAYSFSKARDAEVERDRAIASEIEARASARHAEDEARRLAAKASATKEIAE